MGYAHSLTTEASLKVGTTLEQVVTALAPLFDYFGYDGFKAFAGKARTGDNQFSFDPESGWLELSTSGEVGYSFRDLVVDAAAALGPLTETPSEFVLSDYDTGDLDDAREEILYGATVEAVERYEFQNNLGYAMSLLDTHLPRDVVSNLREIAEKAYQAKTVATPAAEQGVSA